MAVITSRSNPRIKAVRSLRERKVRQETGLFVVEGIRHVGEAVEAGAQIEALYYTPDRLQSQFALLLVEQQAQRGVPCYETSAEVFAALAEKENPQGLLAVVRIPQKSLLDLSPQNFPWGVALVAPQDPGNLGSILRTIDAVGASGLLLLDSNLDATHPGAVRASMGALFWAPVVSASFRDFETWAQPFGYKTFGTSAHGSLDYRQIPGYPRPCILLLGSEREGLSPEQTAFCDALVRLPMRGRATSLNLAIAAGVMLYDMLARPASGAPDASSG
jgi:TrmH family RNA methyltransferase